MIPKSTSNKCLRVYANPPNHRDPPPPNLPFHPHAQFQPTNPPTHQPAYTNTCSPTHIPPPFFYSPYTYPPTAPLICSRPCFRVSPGQSALSIQWKQLDFFRFSFSDIFFGTKASGEKRLDFKPIWPGEKNPTKIREYFARDGSCGCWGPQTQRGAAAAVQQGLRSRRPHRGERVGHLRTSR